MFFKKGRGRCGCVYGTKGAVDRKSLGTTDIDVTNTLSYWLLYTDQLLEILSDEHSLWRSCELGDDVKDLITTDCVLII
jgi:hypothetical protein